MTSRIPLITTKLPIIKTVLKSADGVTRNYVMEYPHLKQIIEARYVRRHPTYISSYLSSHTGCRMSCQMCWLTKTGQADFHHSTIETYGYQLNTVLSNIQESAGTDKSKIRINVNFMAKGECMANKYVVKQYQELYDHLQDVSTQNGYGKIKMNLSSIYPNVLRPYRLSEIFRDRPVNFYYSIYTLDPVWRKKNMPNAMDPEFALSALRELQGNHKSNTVVFHCAFIKNSNDSIESVERMAEKIKSYDFPRTKFNLVRYNPPPNDNSTEADLDRLNHIFEIMNGAVTNKVETQKSRIIERVGPDVYTSCGMFTHNIDSLLESINEKINEFD